MPNFPSSSFSLAIKFTWQGTVYHYNIFPFELATALWVLIKPVLAHMRSKVVRLIARLDNLLTIGKDNRKRKSQESLGFVVNLDKSQAINTWKMEFLGFVINSVLMTFKFSQEKVKEIMQKCGPLKTEVNNMRG